MDRYADEAQPASQLSAGRQAKHIESVIMIGRLNSTVLKLQELIDELLGQPVEVPVTGKACMENPSLADFLNSTPEAINSISNRLEDQIGHLRDILL